MPTLKTIQAEAANVGARVDFDWGQSRYVVNLEDGSNGAFGQLEQAYAAIIVGSCDLGEVNSILAIAATL